MSSPRIHDSGKIWEVSRCWVWILTSNIRVGGNIPEVSPLCIERRWTWSLSFVLSSIGLKKLFVISTFFCILWSGPYLIIVLRKDFLDGPFGVVFFSPAVKVSFHHIKELGILGLINSGIFDDKTAIFVKGFGNLFAVCFG